jgi:hypothetical protein
MVGGKVVQVYRLPERAGIAWVNTYCDKEKDYCAVLVEVGDEDIRLGDILWWQSNRAMWTTPDRVRQDVSLKRIGFSGVHHPLGEEYEARYNFEPIYQKQKTDFRKLAFAAWNLLMVNQPAKAEDPWPTPELTQLHDMLDEAGALLFVGKGKFESDPIPGEVR